MSEKDNSNDYEKDDSIVKSTAVVKYSIAQTPATFAKLQCNTDLNSPPSNWLSSSADSYGLQHILSNSTGFTSFRMAHMFPDYIGEVDIISDAENIKKLLKLSYSHGPISMMVHRVENTLLIDDFDIHKHLLRTAETEWVWLKKFFFDNIQKALTEKNQVLYKRNNSRYALEQKNLMSKFLYRSLVENHKETKKPNKNDKIENRDIYPPIPLAGPALPEPSIDEENVERTKSPHKYNRNVLWTFEDIQMLIGTDLPIFGGKEYPCISLRLRDMNKPINVLTGIDYWLDNLMSNVPEVVMCYHLNGIVQKYEFIKTEDLPYLEDSKFSPKLIRDIAQNILSFLKSNATKAGHTYWLLKGRNDDVVKLYDLTSICNNGVNTDDTILTEEDDDTNKTQNPFTIPVAMLLYRVGRNMKNNNNHVTQSGTVKLLLKNCIKLLNKQKYPQIITSSHYMLADLYVPADTNPNAPSGFDNTNQETDYFEDDSEEDDSNNEEIKQIRLNDPNYQKIKQIPYKTPPPISGGIIERCLAALNHVVQGLDCLKYFPSCMETNKQPEDLKMACPNKPIPMPYKEKSRQTKELSLKNKTGKMPTWQEPDKSDDASWYNHLKTLHYEKACLVYATLAEQEYGNENYGSSLKYMKVLLCCQMILNDLNDMNSSLSVNSGNTNYSATRYVQEYTLLGRAGDCYCMIVQSYQKFSIYKEQYNFKKECEDVTSVLMKEIVEENAFDVQQYQKWCELFPECLDDCSNMEQLLLISSKCYEGALQSNPGIERTNLLKRLGNVQNELASFYMNITTETSEVQKNLKKALTYLESGIHSFEAIDDKANLALLHSNMGRLMRMLAHFHSTSTIEKNKNEQLSEKEKYYYNRAINSYNTAKKILGDRKTNPDIWDVVTWDLSTTAFNLAVILQDYPILENKSDKEIEQAVLDSLKKALDYCDLKTQSFRLPLYQFRAAKIHHRIGSLYHNSYRNIISSLKDDNNQKQLKNANVYLKLCELHYKKSMSILMEIEDVSEFLVLTLEFIGLHQFILLNTTSLSNRFKTLCSILNLIVNTLPMLKIISDKNQKMMNYNGDDNKKNQKDTTNYETDLMEKNESHLLSLLESQTQSVLLNFVKYYNQKGKTSKNSCEDFKFEQLFKQLYSLSLKKSNDISLSFYLYDLLSKIKTELKKSTKILEN